MFSRRHSYSKLKMAGADDVTPAREAARSKKKTRGRWGSFLRKLRPRAEEEQIMTASSQRPAAEGAEGRRWAATEGGDVPVEKGAKTTQKTRRIRRHSTKLTLWDERVEKRNCTFSSDDEIVADLQNDLSEGSSYQRKVGPKRARMEVLSPPEANLALSPILQPDVETPRGRSMCLEVQQRQWGAESRAKLYQAYRGQIQLEIYMNNGLLTAHIIGAKQLISKRETEVNSFVKLWLSPDRTKRTKCATDLVPENFNPEFNEKFSYELLAGDIDKRLVVSVWNKSRTKGRCELLGVTSFGVKNIVLGRSRVRGSYYLLDKKLGREKHLAVFEAPPTPLLSTGDVTLNKHQLLLKRAKSGYGFTLAGRGPCFVTRLNPGGAAEAAGLKVKDVIVKVNGEHVGRQSSENVGRIVRHSTSHVLLEVHRQTGSLSSSSGGSLLSSKHSLSLHSMMLDDSTDSESEPEEEAFVPSNQNDLLSNHVELPSNHFETYTQQRRTHSNHLESCANYDDVPSNYMDTPGNRFAFHGNYHSDYATPLRRDPVSQNFQRSYSSRTPLTPSLLRKAGYSVRCLVTPTRGPDDSLYDRIGRGSDYALFSSSYDKKHLNFQPLVSSTVI